MPVKHKTNKKPTDSTYSALYSGVTFTPPTKKTCVKCGTRTHKEGDSFYCPKCDDYVKTRG